MNQYPPPPHRYPPPPQPPQPPPPPPVPVRPQPHRSYTKTIVVVAVVVLVGCLGLSGASFGLYKYFDSLAEPKPLASAFSEGPIYRKVPSACSLPVSATRDLVPAREEANGFDNEERAARNEGARTHCHWGMSVPEGKRRAQTRELKLTATAYLDGYETGGAQAKKVLDDHKRTAERNASDPVTDSTFGPVEPLSGLGEEAYRQDSVTRSGYTYGGTAIWALVDNLVVEVSYHGSDNTDTRERPMPADRAREGAEAAAREFVKLLQSCADCRR